MAFYDFRQNNSGGYFVYNPERGISVHVIVEADSHTEANRKAENIGLYWNGTSDGPDCSCCGDRWYRAGAWGDEGDEVPSIYGEPVQGSDMESLLMVKWVTGPEAYIHYADGRVESALDGVGID